MKAIKEKKEFNIEPYEGILIEAGDMNEIELQIAIGKVKTGISAVLDEVSPELIEYAG